jgi:peroxiredoxin
MQVVSHYAEIQALDAQVVAISFGTPYWARVWLQETEAPFPLLLDPTHHSYQAYGLERSRLRAYSPKTLLYYLRAAVTGEKSLGNRGDTGQLGGDFIVDAAGIMRLAYASQEPVDRPSIQTLLAVLHELE